MFNKNEIGRSMVEMLGVLAIIGVLSIGGIAGYQMAMEQHKANEFLNAFNIGWIEAQPQLEKYKQQEEDQSESIMIGNAQVSWGFDKTAGNVFYYSVEIPKFSSGVCKKVLNMINTDEMKNFGFLTVVTGPYHEDLSQSLDVDNMCKKVEGLESFFLIFQSI